MKIIGIHGLGDHRNDPWARKWNDAIQVAMPETGCDFIPFSYDDIFERVQISPMKSMSALAKLIGSGIWSSISGLRTKEAATKGMFDGVNHWLRWYAGYVVGWLEDPGFRADVRKRLLTLISQEKPDLIAAHSLGSLISYDAITSDEDLNRHHDARDHLKKVAYVTLGSQLGNPFVRGNLTPGRIEMPNVSQWYHLYNSEDDVFTSEIRLPGEKRFLQVNTFFDIDGFADHDAVQYLQHPATRETVWTPFALKMSKDSATRKIAGRRLAAQAPVNVARGGRSIRKRALLIGINDYPNPADRLAGCVNDVYLMSSVIQECGFTADEIRIVLNDRATAKGILDRMHWLLDGAAPGDELVFFYSGHGAQLPTYGEGDVVDRMDETLVPYDFAWTPETCITDDQIYDLYSQLHYDTRFVMIFDCCHSGGIYRDGGPTVRGLTPPDDIRHRALRWDSKTSMWVPRDLKTLNANFSPVADIMRNYCGASGAKLRLGRAMRLRQESYRRYQSKKPKDSIRGPYLPVIMEACRENELAYEYRHGAQSYGAFTYSLADILRKEQDINFNLLIKKVGRRLKSLHYDQAPGILGPNKIIRAKIPWCIQS